MTTTVKTLDQLADLINSMDEYNPAVVEDICEANGWTMHDDEWHIANDGKEMVMFNDECEAFVTSIKLSVEELAKANNLEFVQFSSEEGVTGFDSWEQADKFADEHDGHICAIKRRDGHKNWELCNRMFQPYSADALCGCDDSLYYPSAYDSYDAFKKNEIDCLLDDVEEGEEAEANKIVSYYNAIWSMLEDIKARQADECVLAPEEWVKDKNTLEIVPMTNISYSYDVYTYGIAVIID
jgi:hypothetical protein